MKCEDLDPAQALKLWDEMLPFIKEALAYDLYATVTTDMLHKQVASGFARVLVCNEGAELVSATLIQLYLNAQQERILHIVCTAGSKADEWLAVLNDKMKEIAADQDCAAITLAGRPGWVRKLRQFGYRTDQIIMRMNNDGWSKQEQRRELPKVAIVR